MKRLRFLAAEAAFLVALAASSGVARCETLAKEPASLSDMLSGGVAPLKAPAPSAATLQAMARKAAEDHALPAAYFVRLIARESRFDSGAVSRAGALGISQFMPGTAAERGLSNPFDPAEALPKSAGYLSDLRGEFGNLGLAAAAYNAGPARIHRWLAGQSRLPGETLRYVLAVTGRDAEAWAPPGAKLLRGPADEGRLRPDDQNLQASPPKNWELALLFALAPSNARVIAAMTPVSGHSLRRDKRAGRRPSPAASLEQKLCSTCIFQAAY